MECRLAHAADEWSCQISLRLEYDGGDRCLPEVHERAFGPRLTDKAAVEPALRRAQAATLNLTTPSDRFLDMDAAELEQWMNPKSTVGRTAVAFSRNTICVDLKGPNLGDLSFVDLPGRPGAPVGQSLTQASHRVGAERGAACGQAAQGASYVGGNCLILVVLPMSGMDPRPVRRRHSDRRPQTS